MNACNAPVHIFLGLALNVVVWAGISGGIALPAQGQTYSCLVEARRGHHTYFKSRLVFDNGRYREEQLDPQSGRTIRVVTYNRDGQGISYAYYSMKPPRAGIDLQAAMYRLAKDHPEQFARSHGVPSSVHVEAREPRPTFELEKFNLSSSPDAREVGKDEVDGKPCVTYSRRGANVSVWRGLVVRRIRGSQSGSDEVVQFSQIKLNPKLPQTYFDLLPGTEVKVPADLHVKLPPNVKRIEYPGNGFLNGSGNSSARPNRRS